MEQLHGVKKNRKMLFKDADKQKLNQSFFKTNREQCMYFT